MVHGPHLDADRRDAGHPFHFRDHVVLDARPEGAGGHGEVDLHDGLIAPDGDVSHHPELDDVGVEFRVDDAFESTTNVVVSDHV